MLNRKPKSFSIQYESGVSGEFCDPRTGMPWHRLKWSAFKTSLQSLARHAQEPVTLINEKSRDSLTVTPEGHWS